MDASEKKSLKIGELASESGLPVTTVRHYVNEGLLGVERKTARNMAYYPREALDRLSLIKVLQDELYLPLKVIKKLLKADEEIPEEDYDIILEVRARLADQHRRLLPEVGGVPRSVVDRLTLSNDELEILEDTGIVTPAVENGESFYDELDYRILKTLSGARESGFSSELGFNIDDLSLYVVALKQLVAIETRIFAKRVSSDMGVDELVGLIREGIPAVNEVMGALHTKFLLEQLSQPEKREGVAR